MKKYILITIFLVLLAGSYFGYKLYNKEHIDVAVTEAEYIFSASELFAAFEADEQQATATYADRVIAVKGTITEVDLSNENQPQVVLEANGDDGYIRCDFKLEFKNQVAQLELGQVLRLKGMCKGMNSSDELDLLSEADVSLANCIIIEEE